MPYSFSSWRKWLWLWSTGARAAESREQLEQLEAKRKALRLKAKHCRLSFFSLMHFEGTVSPRILTNSLTWFSLATYIGWRVVLFQWKPASSETYIGLSDLSPIISFVVFIFVFLNSSLYARFYDQYMLSMSLEGRIFDCCLLAKSFLPKEHQFRMWRRLNAAHCLGYVGLTQGKIYSRENFLDSLLEEHQLLTAPELKRINEIDPTRGGSCVREVLAWIIMDIKNHLSSLSNATYADALMAKDIINQVLTFRGKVGSIYDWDDMPIPLIYTHLVVLIAWVFLPLYSFAVAANVRVSTANSSDYDQRSITANAAIAEILPYV